MTHATGKWIALLAGTVFLAAASHGRAEELAGGGIPFRVVGISPEACAQVSTYLPGADVEYQPGVAADGTSVAPADVDPPFVPRTVFSFPIEIEPFPGNPQFSPATGLVVADVTIDARTGRMTIDGQDVTGADRALAEACASRNVQPSD
jgi:hypothetical protein